MAKKRVMRKRKTNEFQKIEKEVGLIEKEVEKDAEEVEKWIIERRKFFIKLGLIVALLIFILLYARFFT